MIKEAAVEEQDAHMTEDGLSRAAAGMQTNSISLEKLEDGELEEEPESAQANPNGESLHVRGEGKAFSFLIWLICHKGPSTIEFEPKERLANASTAVDQQEKPGMPNAIIDGSEVSKFHLAVSVRGNLTDFCLVKDEALKNLMMSWYYAGYYTGLYEGQQQVQSTPLRQDR